MLDPRLLARLEHKKALLDVAVRVMPERNRLLPPAAVARLKELLTFEWIYNSNAIERSLTLYLEACIPQMSAPAPEQVWTSLA